MLLDERDQLLRTMEAAVDGFPWEQEEAYADYLAQTFHYASHSLRLLGVMLARLPLSARELHEYVCLGLREEKGHENLAMSDLRALGFDIERFPELPACRLLWEPQYYKAEHVDPTAVMGYILMLESLAVTRAGEMMRRAARPGAQRFLSVHAAADVEHVARLLERIRGLDATRQDFVRQNMAQTADAYRALLDQIATRSAVSAGR